MYQAPNETAATQATGSSNLIVTSSADCDQNSSLLVCTSKKILKGVVGLCGLSVLAGLGYWVISGLGYGTKSENLSASGREADQNHNNGGTSESSVALEVIDEPSTVSAVSLSSISSIDKQSLIPHLSTIPAPLDPTALDKEGVGSALSESTGSENVGQKVFSTNDLVYREKEGCCEDAAEKNRNFVEELQPKLLGSSGLEDGYYLNSVVELSNIENGWGAKIVGENDFEGLGSSISDIKDFNGDGFGDFAIVAQGYREGGQYISLVNVIFGNNHTQLGDTSLSSLNGNNGFKIICGQWLDCNGLYVFSAGDFNGDRFDDIALVLMYDSPNAIKYAGSAYVIFGTNQTMPSRFSLSSINGTNGFKINGDTSNSFFGYTISAGNFNGDDFDDLAIGAYLSPSSGTAYVLFGTNRTLPGINNITILNGTNGFRINGENSGDHLGGSINLGDVNNDRLDDILISATGSSPYGITNAGSVYVIFGTDHGNWTSIFNISSPNGNNVTRINGAVADYYIGSVRTGDFNGDGCNDIAIGASNASPNGLYYAGDIYVVFGNTIWDKVFNLSSINGTNGFEIVGKTAVDKFGGPVRFGNFNNDEFSDLVVAATYSSPNGINNAGSIMVIFGTNRTWSRQSNISSLVDGHNGIQINGEAESAGSGSTLSIVKNFAADNASYLAISAPNTASGAFVYAGKIYFIYNCCKQKSFLVNNTIAIYQGRTVLITNSNFAASNPASRVAFEIFNNQNGYFSIVGQSSVPIVSFTAEQIAANQIQFTHTGGSLYPPSWYARYNDGLVHGNLFPATVFFSAAPVLGNNNFIINQGEELLVTSAVLSANAIGTDPDNLMFYLSNMQHCHFALATNIIDPITSFAQSAILNSSLVLVATNLPVIPEFYFSISDNITTVGPYKAVIDYDDIPVISINDFVIGQGKANIITSGMLSVTHNYYVPANNIKFLVSNVIHGNFTRKNASITPIFNFFQYEVIAQNITFLHDGEKTAPSFSFIATDGRTATDNTVATIHFDFAPILVNNNLRISQGETAVLNPSMLSASDVDNDPATLIFMISNLAHGKFYSILNPGVSVLQFTQGQVINGLIRVAHDGAAVPLQYYVSVDDGIVTTLPNTANITFNLVPILNANSLDIGQGQKVLLTSINLRASDFDSNEEDLVFIVSNIKSSEFTLTSDSSRAITQFTQRQLNDSQVQIIHDGTVFPPRYSVSVSDGIISIPAISATINFYEAPTLVIQNPSINQGQVIFISNQVLFAESGNFNDSSIFFVVINLQHGYFSRLSSPAVFIANFTQAEVNRKEIIFTQDNSPVAPNCLVSVRHSYASSSTLPLLFDFNAAPVLVVNRLVINQGAMVLVTASMLRAIDSDSPNAALLFNITEIYHGRFIIGNITAATLFIQNDININRVYFSHDGSDYPPKYKVSVIDNRLAAESFPAVVTFFPRAGVSNSVRNTIIGLSISGGIGFFLFFVKLYLDGVTKTKFNDNSITSRICVRLVKTVNFASCLGYLSDDTAQDLNNAVAVLVTALRKAGVNFDEIDFNKQSVLVRLIVQQIINKLLPKKDVCCYKFGRFFMNFCSQQLDPRLIETHSARITAAIIERYNNFIANDVVAQLAADDKEEVRDSSKANSQSKARDELLAQKYLEVKKTFTEVLELRQRLEPGENNSSLSNS